MDFMKSYSSILSSKENSQSDKKQQYYVKKYQAAQSTVISYIPSQPKSQPTLQQSDLKRTNEVTVAQHNNSNSGSVSARTNSAFNQMVEDAYYVFRKHIQGALEQGIYEHLEIEKSSMLQYINQYQIKIEMLEKELNELRKQADKYYITIAHKEESQSKLALLVADLKSYRKDSLFGLRCLREWGRIARHSGRYNTYINLIYDQHIHRTATTALSAWRIRYLRYHNEKIVYESEKQVKQLHAEREDYFSGERNNYEKQIAVLKKELQGFAVKERKMKDAMKYAFLNGINAISQEATVALDKTDKMSMERKLQEELERYYVKSGGNVNNVKITSPSSESVHEEVGYVYHEEEELELREYYTENNYYTPTQYKVTTASPARHVTQHLPGQVYGSVQREMETVQSQLMQQINPVSRANLPRPEPQIQKVKYYKVRGLAAEQGTNLATRLRAAARQGQGLSGGNLYRESLKNITLKIEKEQ